MISGKTFLVTGGSGFLGANLIRRLLSESAKWVYVLDNFSTGFPSFITDLPRLTLIKGCVSNHDLVNPLVAKSDIVFSLAACGISVWQQNPTRVLQANIEGIMQILFACNKHGGKKVIHISSASVYGNPHYLPSSEEDVLNITDAYGATKLMGEHCCLWFHERYGVPVTILRYSNIYGPYQSTANPYCGVIAKFLDAMLRGESVTIYGNGEQTRDFTYVDDAIEATILSLIHPGGLIFNVATGLETSINGLVDLINDIGVLRFNHAKPKPHDNIQRRCLNIERAKKILGWQPRILLKEGLVKTLEWIKGENMNVRT